MRTGRGVYLIHSPILFLYFSPFSIHSPTCPHDSGPLQWARSNCALKRSVATRPNGLRWKKTNAPIAPTRPLPGDSAPLNVINTAFSFFLGCAYPTQSPFFVFFVVMPPHSYRANYIRNAHKWNHWTTKRAVSTRLFFFQFQAIKTLKIWTKCSHFFLSFRVEFLLKTDSGYPKDTGVSLFTLATPGNFLSHSTPRSTLPVSALAHSRGPGARQAEAPEPLRATRNTP